MTAIYRTTRRLSVGIAAGEAFLATRLSAAACKVLTQRGIIHELPQPPLRLLTLFELEWRELARRGILTLGDLLSSTAPDLASWRVIGWEILNPPPVGGCSNCRRK